jgi:hypothetical protein
MTKKPVAPPKTTKAKMSNKGAGDEETAVETPESEKQVDLYRRPRQRSRKRVRKLYTICLSFPGFFGR